MEIADYSHIAKKLETISAIHLTPFHPESREINWDDLESNVNFLIQSGCQVIVTCGNTGEFYSLTIEEAKQITERVTEIVAGRALVVAGIGYSVKTAVELGQHAQASGADCVMIHQPHHPYLTNKGVLDYYQAIFEAVDLPIILYYKDPNISDEVLVQLSAADKLVGVKYAINDLQRFAKTVRSVPNNRFTWICGTAEKWAPYFFFAGAKGFTSGLVNVYPKKSLEMLTALQTGDFVSVWNIWGEILPFENLRAKYSNGNNVAVVKEAANILGLPAGVTREPVAPLDEEDRAEVLQIIRNWGLIREEVSNANE